MTVGGKPTPVYVVTNAEVASGNFSIAPGKAQAISALSVSDRGSMGGNVVPVYVVEQAEAEARGIVGGLEGMPVVDGTDFGRGVMGTRQAIPVYVVSGTLESAPPIPPTPPAVIVDGNPMGPWIWWTYTT